MELDKEMIKELKEELKNISMFPCDAARCRFDEYQYFLDKTMMWNIDFRKGNKVQTITLPTDKEWDQDKIQEQLDEIFVKGGKNGERTKSC